MNDSPHNSGNSGISAGPMGTRPSPQDPVRPKRFALHFPVYFRAPGGPIWMEGTTENISYSGMLLRSPSPLALNSTLQLRLQLKGKEPTEIRCKGAVVRVEQRNGQEAPIAFGVMISNYRFVRGRPLAGGPKWNA